MTSQIDAAPRPAGIALSESAKGWMGQILLPVLLLALCGLMLLSGYDNKPMQMWDESRNANNAIEMVTSGNWLVLQYGGVPDHWNTKPPLLIWLVALLLKAGAPSLLALRLPSIMATTGTVMMAYGYCRYYLRNETAGLFTSLLLLSSIRLISFHGGRAGDFDALLILFMTAYSLSFFAYLGSEGRARSWAMAGVCAGMSLAVMTKGTAGGFAVPGLILYTLWQRQLFETLRDRRVWIALAAFVAVVGTYYLLRESADPGYLQAVVSEEITGRYFNVMHDASVTPMGVAEYVLVYYVPWSFALALALLPSARPADRRSRSLVNFSLTVATSILLILMRSKTVLSWYPQPIIPFMALPAGIALSVIFAKPLREGRGALSRLLAFAPRVGIAGLFLILVCRTFLYEHVQMHDLVRREMSGQLQYGSLIDQVRRDGAPRALVLIDSGYPNHSNFVNYNAVAEFYAKEAGRDGIRVKVAPPGTALAADDWVGTCDPASRDWLQEAHGLRPVFANDWCVLGRVGT